MALLYLLSTLYIIPTLLYLFYRTVTLFILKLIAVVPFKFDEIPDTIGISIKRNTQSYPFNYSANWKQSFFDIFSSLSENFVPLELFIATLVRIAMKMKLNNCFQFYLFELDRMMELFVVQGRTKIHCCRAYRQNDFSFHKIQSVSYVFGP